MNSSEFRPPRSTFHDWHIRWDRNDQTYRSSKKRWTPEQRPIPPHIEPLLYWTVRSGVNTTRDHGVRFRDIYFSKLDLGEDDDWHFAHALGRGGFGAVAMFEKHNRNSYILEDQVAVKTTEAKQADAADRNKLDMSAEAAMMIQTNDLGEDGMLALRQFKFYDKDTQWKYYFEYCPYGDLERLRVRYKAYGRYLPELFLWHLFHWLAKTLKEYTEYNDWCHIDAAHWGETVTEGFVLHSDIKTANILLGPPDPNVSDDDDETTLYPIPRIADLGLASVETLRDRGNWAARLVKGTTWWHPPEIRWKQMKQRSEFYPFGWLNPDQEDKWRKARHKITPKANMWAVGAVMFSMASLMEADFLSDRVNMILQEVLPAPNSASGQSIIQDHDFNMLDGQYYSMALRDLIKSCLILDPEHRPSEDDLISEALNGYTRCLNTMKRQGFGGTFANNMSLRQVVETQRDYKVYFRKNEIDGAPDNYRFDHPNRGLSWWQSYFIHDIPWVPLSWGRLWPNTLPDALRAPAGWPGGYRDAFNWMRNYTIAARQGIPHAVRHAARGPLNIGAVPSDVREQRRILDKQERKEHTQRQAERQRQRQLQDQQVVINQARARVQAIAAQAQQAYPDQHNQDDPNFDQQQRQFQQQQDQLRALQHDSNLQRQYQLDLQRQNQRINRQLQQQQQIQQQQILQHQILQQQQQLQQQQFQQQFFHHNHHYQPQPHHDPLETQRFFPRPLPAVPVGIPNALRLRPAIPAPVPNASNFHIPSLPSIEPDLGFQPQPHPFTQLQHLNLRDSHNAPRDDDFSMRFSASDNGSNGNNDSQTDADAPGSTDDGHDVGVAVPSIPYTAVRVVPPPPQPREGQVDVNVDVRGAGPADSSSSPDAVGRPDGDVPGVVRVRRNQNRYQPYFIRRRDGRR